MVGQSFKTCGRGRHGYGAAGFRALAEGSIRRIFFNAKRRETWSDVQYEKEAEKVQKINTKGRSS